MQILNAGKTGSPRGGLAFRACVGGGADLVSILFRLVGETCCYFASLARKVWIAFSPNAINRDTVLRSESQRIHF